MKNRYLTIGFAIATFFSAKASETDTLSINDVLKDSSIIMSQPASETVIENKQFVNSDKNQTVKAKGKSQNHKEDLNVVKAIEDNPLLDYILKYDIQANRIYPRPALDLSNDEELDDLRMTPLLMPMIFNSRQRDLRIDVCERKKPSNDFKSEILDSLFNEYHSENYVHELEKSVLLNAESRHIGLIRYDQKNLPKPERMVFQLETRRGAPWSRVQESIPGRDADTKKLPKSEYNPWSKYGYVKLQFSQTYNSPNWSKGGESNMAGLTTLYLEANYSDLKKVQFDNSVEAKIGLNTVSSDSLRNLNVSTDQLRAVSKLGVRMYNDLYYSLSGEFTTQFLNNYKANTMSLKSSLLSPAKLFVGLGVDYKKSDKKKGYNLSVLLTPLTYKLNYLYDNVNLSTSSYGIKDGNHFGSDIGSKISATLTWKFSDQVQWKSNFYYYTDFTYIDSDWENTIDLNLNNYFTTSIYVHLKLDDRLDRDPGESLLQMQELFSFGMVYRW